MSDKVFLVLARTHRRYQDWCKEHDLNPRDSRQAVYVTGHERLHGYSASRVEVVQLQDWSLDVPAEELEEIVWNLRVLGVAL